jgi:hypothetical protein
MLGLVCGALGNKSLNFDTLAYSYSWQLAL